MAAEVKKYGFWATFFVTEGLGFLKNKNHYTTWEEIAELDKMGFEIANHTRSHPNVAGLNADQVAAEIEHIEKRCAEYKIPKPTTFCYPGFSHKLDGGAGLGEEELSIRPSWCRSRIPGRWTWRAWPGLRSEE